MCLAIPGRIIKVDGQKAVVKYPGEERAVLTGGEKVKKGDFVLVQMGIVIKVLAKEEVNSIFQNKFGLTGS